MAKWPNVELGKHLDRNYLEGELFETIEKEPNHIDKIMEPITCESATNSFKLTLAHLTATHYFLVFINLFREMYDSTLGSLGMWMRCLEVLAIGGYLFGLIYCMQVISIFEYWKFLNRNYPEHSEKFRTCFLEEGEWSGTTL